MALAVRATSTYGSTGVVTSFTIPTPTGTVDGDVMFWHIVGQVATLPASPPTGWTEIGSGTTTAQYSILYWRVASGEGANQTSPTLTSARHASTITTLSGADTTTQPDNAIPALTSGTTAITFNAETPTTTGAWVMAFGSMSRASGTAEGTASSTNLDVIDVEGFSTAASAVNVKSVVAHEVWTSGAFTPNMSNSTAMTRTKGLTVAIRPANGAYTGSGNVATTATITASGVVAAFGSGNVAETATITASGVVAAFGSGSVSETATIAASAVTGAVGSGNIASSVNITASATVSGGGDFTGSGNVAETATITASGQVGALGAGSVAETVTVTGSAVVGKVASGSVAPTATISATGVVGAAASANVAPAANLTASATVGRSADGSVASSVTISASAAISFGSSGNVATSVTITASAEVFTTPPPDLRNARCVYTTPEATVTYTTASPRVADGTAATMATVTTASARVAISTSEVEIT